MRSLAVMVPKLPVFLLDSSYQDVQCLLITNMFINVVLFYVFLMCSGGGGCVELSYPMSTLPEHLHSTSLSYAETTLNSRKLVSFPLIAHYLSAGPPLPPTPPFTGRPGHTHT